MAVEKSTSKINHALSHLMQMTFISGCDDIYFKNSDQSQMVYERRNVLEEAIMRLSEIISVELSRSVEVQKYFDIVIKLESIFSIIGDDYVFQFTPRSRVY